MATFGSQQLENMVAVGSTGPRSVRLWFRSARPGDHDVTIWPLGKPAEERRVRTTVPADNACDNTHTLRYPDDFPGAAPLEPLERYQYRVLRVDNGTVLGAGRFETAPASGEDTPERFSFALMSCHQPFTSDGQLSDRSMRLLRLVPRALAEHDVKFVLACGDQVYADEPADFSLADPNYLSTKVYPHRRSLLDCSTAEVRRAYQQRYRIFWQMNELRHVYANYPCYPMLDDHEILDDWGSREVHATRPFASVASGARWAYYDYQGSRVGGQRVRLPSSFHYDFTYGNTAVFSLDVRSERAVGRGNGVFSKRQYDALRTFLGRHRDKSLLAIVTSVPVVHLPGWLVDIGQSFVGREVDFADQWSHRSNIGARNSLLRLLHAHQQANPHQKMLLLSGDVHVGCAFAIHWEGGSKPILYQFSSSALSNRMKRSAVYFARLGPKLTSKIRCGGDGPEATVRLIKRQSRQNNPFGGLNFGVVEVRKRGDQVTLCLKLIGYPPVEQWEARTMFSSGELG